MKIMNKITKISNLPLSAKTGFQCNSKISQMIPRFSHKTRKGPKISQMIPRFSHKDKSPKISQIRGIWANFPPFWAIFSKK